MSLWRHLRWTRVYFNVRRNLLKRKNFTQHDVENKPLKEENEKLGEEENEKLRKEENDNLRKENDQLRKENEQLRKNNVVKDAEIKESTEKPTQIKSPEEEKNTTDYYPNWFDKNKFKNFLPIITAANLVTEIK